MISDSIFSICVGTEINSPNNKTLQSCTGTVERETRKSKNDDTDFEQTPMDHFTNLSIVEISPLVSTHKATRTLRPGTQVQMSASRLFDTGDDSPNHVKVNWSSFIHDLQTKDTRGLQLCTLCRVL